MIDRRVFLKGIVGAGITTDLLRGLKINGSQTEQNKLVSQLLSPEITLVVKVDEVIVHEKTAWIVDDVVMGKDIEFDVCGRCIMGYEPVPIEVRFFTDADEMRSPNPDNFKAGSFHIMTGLLYVDEYIGVNMIMPKFKQIETVLTQQEIDELQRWFAIGGNSKDKKFAVNQQEEK